MRIDFARLTKWDDTRNAAHLGGFDSVVVSGTTNAEILTRAAEFVEASPELPITLDHWAGEFEPDEAASRLAALQEGLGQPLTVRLRLRPGDTRPHATRIAELGEYLTLLKRLWLNSRAFEHQGRFFSLTRCDGETVGSAGTRIRLAVQGSSGLALKLGAHHGDLFELRPDTLQGVSSQIDRARSLASDRGRADKLSFGMTISVRQAGSLEAWPLKGVAAVDAVTILALVDAGVQTFVVTGDIDEHAFAELTMLVRNALARPTAEVEQHPRWRARFAGGGLRFGPR